MFVSPVALILALALRYSNPVYKVYLAPGDQIFPANGSMPQTGSGDYAFCDLQNGDSLVTYVSSPKTSPSVVFLGEGHSVVVLDGSKVTNDLGYASGSGVAGLDLISGQVTVLGDAPTLATGPQGPYVRRPGIGGSTKIIIKTKGTKGAAVGCLFSMTYSITTKTTSILNYEGGAVSLTFLKADGTQYGIPQPVGQGVIYTTADQSFTLRPGTVTPMQSGDALRRHRRHRYRHLKAHVSKR